MKAARRAPHAGAAFLAVGLVCGGMGGAVGAGLITGSQIKDGTITSADIHNGTIGTIDMSAAAKSALRTPGAKQLVVASSEEAVGTNGIDIELSAHCPTGHPYAVSGGANSSVTDSVSISGSFPGGGSPTTPPTSWKASLTNHSPDATIFTVYVVCSA
jgi:hypothetical protein